MVEGLQPIRRMRELAGRILPAPSVTKGELVRGLGELGIREGDEVMVHSSLSRLGRVEGGAGAVVDALLEAVGPEGTVLVPSFAEGSLYGGVFGSWWDPKSTPVGTGRIDDLFWRRPGALRSDHPTCSVAAIGRRAEYFTSQHGMVGDRYGPWGTGSFSSRSPWEKMVRQNLHCVLLGVSECALGHHAEAFLVTEHIKGLSDQEERGFAAGLLHKYYNDRGVWPGAAAKLCRAFLKRQQPGAPALQGDQDRGAESLKRPCHPDRVVVGRAICRRFGAAEYFHWCVDQCRRDPETWLDREYLAWKARIDQRLAAIRAHQAGEQVAQPLLNPEYKRDLGYWVERVRRDRTLRRLRRKIFKPPKVTKEDIVRGLREVGLKEGDEVMFHSSLYALGDVVGGAEAVIDAFLEAVGPGGTVMVPSYAAYKQRGGSYGSWWDPKTTPVYTGHITEAFWRRPEARRSNHPSHAIAAIGRRAEYFTSGHGIEGDRYGQWDTGEFASWSPWQKMVLEDINYMLIGIVKACTLGYHAMACVVTEHLKGLPEVEAKGLATCLLNLYYNRRGVSPRVPTRLRAAYLKRWQPGRPTGTPAEYKKLKPLERPCLPDRVVIGKGVYWRFSAAEYFHWCVDVCLKDPARWVDKDYLAWLRRVERRRAEIADQGQPGDAPWSWIRQEYSET